MRQRLNEEGIAMRIAKEIPAGSCVNLGIGIGLLVANFVPDDRRIIFHSQNGVIGFGKVVTVDEPELMDYYLINAGGQFVQRKPGMSFCDIAEAFDAIRTGRVDITVLGALEVSERGDLANWSTDPKGSWGTIGGAMDMPIGTKKVIVGMTHTTKEGAPKIRKRCKLPLTAPKCVSLIVTDIAVVEVTSRGLLLKEYAPGWTVPEIQALTEARLWVAPDIKEIEL